MDEQSKETPKTEVKTNAPQAAMSPDKRRLMFGVLAYVLFFIPLISGDAKKDEFVKYHTKQGFALFIVSVAIGALGWALPFIYWLPVIHLLNLVTLVLFVLGVINVANNKKEPLPLIGSIGNWLKI